MTVRRRIAAALLLAGAGLVLFAPGAGAHALLQSSDPPGGAQLTEPPGAVTLTFTEDPELSLSNVRVLDASGTSHEDGEPQRVAGRARTIRVRVRALERGVYTVAWRVVSRVDGHATGGAFAFGVGVSPVGVATPPAAAPETPTTSPTEMAGRWFLYAGLLGLIGAAWTTAIAFQAPPARAARFSAVAWLASLGGLLLLGVAQRSAAGVGLGDLFSTPIGRALMWRGAAIGGAGVTLIVSSRGAARISRPAMFVAGILAAGALFAHIDAGHAAASDPVWRNVASQFVHVLAAAIWIGGLAALLIGIRGASSEQRGRAVRRFSAAAGVALLVVAATGIVRAVAEIGSWDGLVSSTYGRLVIAKAALILCLGALGAVNRYRNVPKAAADVSGLRRVSRGELVLAGLALAAAAGLASNSPPGDSPSAEPGGEDRIVASGTNFAETVRVRLEVTPGFSGPNAFVLRIDEPASGDPIDASRVALRFRFVDRTVGETTLELERTGPGVYRGQGVNLSLDGQWTVTILVQRATDSVEIPVEIQTRCRALAIPVSGGPTLYNVQHADGIAQLYADPGTSGFNQIHVTFFDESGEEVPVSEIPSMIGTHDGGTSEFEVRRFGAGHFVADASLTAGGWRFTFAGELPDGTEVRGCFDETIA